MPIKLVKPPEYTNPKIPGVVDHLKGPLMGLLVAKFTIDVETFAIGENADPITIQDPGFQLPGYVSGTSKFENFSLGDLVQATTIKNSSGDKLLGPSNYIIDDYVDVNTIRLAQANGDPLIPVDVGDPFIDGVNIVQGDGVEGVIRLAEEPKAFQFSYGLIENNEPVNYNSKIDSQELKYFLNAGGDIPNVSTLLLPGFKKSAQVGNVSVKKIILPDEDQFDRWRYEVTQLIKIHPYYLTTQKGIIQQGTDKPSIFRGDRSLRHVVRFRFFQENESEQRFQELELQTGPGEVGWLRESYNSQSPSFKARSVDYGNDIDTISKNGTTSMVIEIDELSLDQAGTVVLNFLVAPEEDSQFKDNDSLMNENFCYDSVSITVGGGVSQGDNFGTAFQVFKDCSATTSGGVVTVLADVELGASVLSKIDILDNKFYWLTFNAFSSGKDLATTANETLDQIDFKQIRVIIPEGTIEASSSIIRHADNAVVEGISDVGLILKKNDECVANSLFTVSDSMFSGILLNKAEGQIVITDGASEAVVDSKAFDISNNLVVGNARDVDTSAVTGFNVNPSEIRNNYRLYREPGFDSPGRYAYRLLYPFLFRWESHRELPESAKLSEFIDPSQGPETFRGQNHDWFRLSTIPGFKIVFRIKAEVFIPEINSSAFQSFDSEIFPRDYNSNPEWPVKEIKSFEGATELVSGGNAFIKKGIFTKLEATFGNQGAVDVNNLYIVFHIGQKDNNDIRSIRSFSSLYDREGVSYLDSNGQNGLVKMTQIDPNTVKGECFINPNEFPGSASKYTVFATIDFKEIPVPFIGTFDTTLTAPGNTGPEILRLPLIIESQVLVDWGDGSGLELFTTGQNVIHNYGPGNGGVKTVLVFASDDWTILYDDALDDSKIINVVSWGDSIYLSTFSGFRGCANLEEIQDTQNPNRNIALSGNIADSLFESCPKLTTIGGLKTFDFSHIIRVRGMFQESSIYNEDLGSNFIGPSVINMDSMFQNALLFNNGGSPSIGDWNTENVEDMRDLFENAVDFDQYIGDWNVEKVTTFFQCFRDSRFNQPLTNWNTLEARDMSLMFFQNNRFNSDVSSFNMTKVIAVNLMFQSATMFDQPISNWERPGSTMANIPNFINMFNRANRFNQDIGNWDVSGSSDFQRMFGNSNNAPMLFNNGGSPSIGNWNIRTDVPVSLRVTFENCINFNQDLSSWTVDSVTDLFGTFRMSNGALSGSFNQPIGSWDTSSVTIFSQVLLRQVNFDQDLSNWDFSSVPSNSGALDQSFNLTGFSPANADLLINKINSDAVANNITGVSLGGAGVVITAAGLAARNNLINILGWTISGFNT